MTSRPKHHRGFSWAVYNQRVLEERQRLLGPEADHDDVHGDHADADGLYPPNSCWTRDHPNPPNPHKDLPVYQTIHRIRRDIVDSIEDPYSVEQLRAPRMNISVIRPLVDAFYEMHDVSIVYCLLVNRTQFLYEQSVATHHQTVNLSRALMCEIIAEKILRRYNERNPGPKGLLLLANILVAGFEPFQNAPEEVIQQNAHALHWATARNKDGRPERKLTALEVAIISESKSFLASTACKKVVDSIYLGRLVYTPSSFIDIIPDRWKYKPISLYDPRRGPLLNQYRLIVPRTRNIVEVVHFIILLFLYVMVMTGRERSRATDYTAWELVFDIYAAGWTLDQIASVLEHGWKVYSQNLWSFLDAVFMVIYVIYFVMRMHALAYLSGDEFVEISRTALDVLACGAPVLVPRLAFNIMSENMLFVSLRAMMSDFLTLTLLAVWCFAGFLLSMKWLHNGAHSPVTISKWMVWIWFGLDGTGIQRSPDFHWVLGPALMILFAFLGNTLFLTVLVSMLSNTFSLIASNATAEINFRRAVLTFEGVKSDAIFAYFPPFNILALLLVLPTKLFISERHFHSINVLATRILNAPFLFLISLYERRYLWTTDKTHPRPHSVVRRPGVNTMSFWDFSKFSVHGDIQAVFETEPPQSLLDDIAEDDDLHGPNGERAEVNKTAAKLLNVALEDQFPTAKSPRHSPSRPPKPKRKPTTAASPPRRRRSSASERLAATFSSSPDASSQSKSRRTNTSGPKPHPRMDSIVNLGMDGTDAMDEANERLHKLEDGVERIEAILKKFMELQGDADEDEDDGDGEDSVADNAELNLELETGIHE